MKSLNLQMVGNGAFNNKIDYITIINLVEHQNRITGSNVTVILLKRWIFPIGQSCKASQWRVCYQWGLPRLLSNEDKNLKRINISKCVIFLNSLSCFINIVARL